MERGRLAGLHHCSVTGLDEILAAVDERFAARPAELVVWADPHAGRAPADAEYSRATNPERWRILGGRVDAWIAALVESGLASVEEVAARSVRWEVPPYTRISSAVRVIPRAPGTRGLIVARSQVGEVPKTGITLGWGDPAVLAGLFPFCGCDACDGGAQYELDVVDQRLGNIISGRYRRLTRGDSTITAETDHAWSATGEWEAGDIEAVLADPSGWLDLSGAAWVS